MSEKTFVELEFEKNEYPNKKIWIQKNILKNYIYNAIRDFGLPFVLYCVEQGITHLASTPEEWAKEFNLADMFAKKKMEKSQTNYTGKITISQLAKERYGIESNSSLRTSCPFHEGAENKTSFKFDDEKNRFKCWSCGEHGNMIRFIKLMEEKRNDSNKNY